MAQENSDHVGAWLEGALTDEEFAAKATEKDLVQYKQILAEVDSWVPTNEDVSLDLNDFRSKKKAKEVAFPMKNVLMIAASISLLVVSYFIFFSAPMGQTSVVADAGVKEILLPDGASKLYLSHGAKATWKDSDWEDGKRTLSLEGKGYLEVEKGKSVYSGDNCWNCGSTGNKVRSGWCARVVVGSMLRRESSCYPK